jgi:pyruvate/2-oxoglutarate dehydrogenase complex dihydrolipoamide dehydrogenase (E3) component
MHDVIVIGGGPAGVTAALRARELGANVALVERGRMGGTCTNDGCVPTRVLAKAARLLRDAEQFTDYGLVGEVPGVDFAGLLASTQRTIYRMHEKKQLLNRLEQAGVTVYPNAGQAQFTDPHTIRLADGRALQGAKFILCAGGRAHHLTFPGNEHALTHSDVWSLKSLPGSIAVIGGSATGCQLATIFDTLGSQVTVLEVAPRILGREDSLVSQAMEDAFHRRGIRVITGIGGVERIDKPGNQLVLWYSQEGKSQSITVESVILATGWPSNADGLNLSVTGVQLERGYVVVDDYLRTTAEHIFAAGDITGRMMLVQSAGYEARIAAENAVLGVGQRYSHHIVPHGGFTDPEYGSVGLTEAQASSVEGGYVVAVVPFAEMDRAVIDRRTEGFCKLIVSVETHRILGAHIVGEQALEVIHLVAAGMTADMWVEQLAELEIAYPTFTAVVGLAARQILRDLGVVPLSSQWRSTGKTPAAEWERSDAAGDWSSVG